jgi:predicted membrane-bound spermidine synthase
VPTRVVDDVTLAGFFEFPKDMSPVEVRINQIFDQQVVRYFRLDWADL